VTAGKGGPPLGVVVVNYGSHELIEQNLAPVRLDESTVRVVVVDNASTTAERAAIAGLCSARGWELVALPDNRGFGAGVNAGVAAARALGCVCFLLLNPDARVTAQVIGELREHSLAEPRALISPRIVDGDGAPWFDGAVVSLRTGRIRSRAGAGGIEGDTTTEWLTGACLVVHEQMIDALQGLDEEYFLYWEDLELSHRCLAAGGRLVLRRDLVATHIAGGTQGPRQGRAKSSVYYRYNCRNRLLFAARNLGRRDLVRWILSTPAVSWEILMRGGRRQLLRRPGLAWAAVAGSWAGVRLALAALVTEARSNGPGRSGSVLVVHPGAELYGSDRMLLESVRGLLSRGMRVVVALPVAGPLGELLQDAGAEVVTCRMPVLRKSALRPAGLTRLAGEALLGLGPAVSLIRRAGGAGVYVSTLTIPLWPVLGRLLGRRVTTHVHEAEGTAPAVVRWLLTLPTVPSSLVITNSEYSREVLIGAFPWLAGRVQVVLNGVEGPARTTPARPRPADPVRLLFVGRLSHRKGPQVALAVLAELDRRGVRARLELAGAVFPGNEAFQQELVAQAHRLRISERVHFLGFTDRWAALAAADIVLIPSVVDEPFGNTAVEAVLAGRPVVVSATSGLREAAAGYATARIVDPADVPSWADAIEELLDDWPGVLARLPGDVRGAARRHDPSTYRDRVADIVLDGGERHAQQR
jgi:GT2 family glycosyltransferase